ncbi:MAG: bifunctional 2-polyprenyl-6-hydroxyphenol methylase/3-demethylubiquinol 3-O-methyltransferase UbiG [Pseudomonadales bacterium]
MANLLHRSTVDPAEVARFDRLAATWWDAQGPMWPLHRLNELRAPFIVDTVARHLTGPRAAGSRLAGLSVLDVGCGAGLLSEAMAEQGAQVTGIDPSGRNIAIARHHAALRGMDIDYRAVTADALGRRSFDVVLNMEVVEHVERLPDFMAQCCALTRPGGLQFLATINRTWRSFLVAIVGAEYLLRWLPRGTHHWGRFVTPHEAESLLAAGGLDVVVKSGVSVNPFSRHFRLTDSDHVNYMVAARRRC